MFSIPSSRNYYYDDGYYYDDDYYYDEEDDGYYQGYSSSRGRGRGRSTSTRGSSRGRYASTSNTRSSSRPQKSEAGSSDTVEVKIGQWNGPEEEENKETRRSGSTGESRDYSSGGYSRGGSRGKKL